MIWSVSMFSMLIGTNRDVKALQAPPPPKGGFGACEFWNSFFALICKLFSDIILFKVEF